MEFLAEIRWRHLVIGESISAIACDLRLSRPTVRKHLKTVVELVYHRQQQPSPKLEEFEALLITWLEADAGLPKSRRRTALRLFEGLQCEGNLGTYDSIQRFVKQWKARRVSSPALKEAFVPLVFAPGQAGQFDWSYEQVELGGVVQTIKLAHFRLACSRQMFVGHTPAKLRRLCWMPTIGPSPSSVACTPAAGWEKGQVENQVGNIREWLFTPRPSFANFAELNAWLATLCRELAERRHPTEKPRRTAECFADEQAHLRPVTEWFDGYVEQ